MMHHAHVDSSKRLQRVLAVLQRRGIHGATSMELIQQAYVVAPGTCVSELRNQGYSISCYREGSVWRYTLEGEPSET